MADLTPAQRRRGKEWAEQIAALAAKAPDADHKRKAYAVVNSCRQTYGYSPEQKREMVLTRIRLGAATITDLLRETPFPEQEVKEIVNQLEKRNEVRVEYLSNTGTTGRRPKMIFPV